MQPPIPYSPDVETIAEDEAETLQQLEEALRQILETTAEDYGHAVRPGEPMPDPRAGSTGSAALTQQPELAVRLPQHPGDAPEPCGRGFVPALPRPN